MIEKGKLDVVFWEEISHGSDHLLDHLGGGLETMI